MAGYPGRLRVADEPDSELIVTLQLAEGSLTINSGSVELGSWPATAVLIDRISSTSFLLTVEDERMTFVPDNLLEFVYEALKDLQAASVELQDQRERFSLRSFVEDVRQRFGRRRSRRTADSGAETTTAPEATGHVHSYTAGRSAADSVVLTCRECGDTIETRTDKALGAWHAPYVPAERDGQAVWILLLAYLVVNRLIPDFYVLPVGRALRPSQLLVMLMALAWLVWAARKGAAAPRGAAGLTGALLIGVVALAPLWHLPTLSVDETDAIERGLIFATLYAIVFVVAYRIGRDTVRAMTVMTWMVWLGAIEALMSIYESFTLRYVTVSFNVWRFLGLIPDPGLGNRSFEGFGRFRLGGFRPTATSPHPIVLTGLLAIGIILAIIIYLREESQRRRMLMLALIAPQALALIISHTRTGLAILLVAVLVIIVAEGKRAKKVMSLGVVGVMMLGLIIAIRPSSARAMLTLVTFQESASSLDARLVDYDRIMDLLEPGKELLGIGYLTHNRDIIQLDNAYLFELLELGLIGLAAYLLFLAATGLRILGAVPKSDGDRRTVLLAALAGSIALVVGSATFDATAFDQFFPSCLMLIAFGLAQAEELRRHRSESPTELDTHAVSAGR